MDVNVLLIGLGDGSVYGLLAAPIVLTYRLTGVANFAQGAMAGVSTFVLYSLLQGGLPGVLAVLGAAVFAWFLGWLIFSLLLLQRKVGRMELHDHITPLIVTLGVFEVLNSLIVLVWGPDARPLGLLGSTSTWRFEIAGVSFGFLRLLPLALLGVAAIAYYVVVFRTPVGLILRATASDDESAAALGININVVKACVWAVSAVVGLIAGLSASSIYYVSPDLMTSLIIPAFVAAILGGMNNVSGALLGGILVGVLTALTASLIGTEFKSIMAIAFAALILIARPRGILSSATQRAV
ncbi:branched-chain amino acid ABC transporter permease [soil metagenome]